MCMRTFSVVGAIRIVVIIIIALLQKLSTCERKIIENFRAQFDLVRFSAIFPPPLSLSCSVSRPRINFAKVNKCQTKKNSTHRLEVVFFTFAVFWGDVDRDEKRKMGTTNGIVGERKYFFCGRASKKKFNNRPLKCLCDGETMAAAAADTFVR